MPRPQDEQALATGDPWSVLDDQGATVRLCRQCGPGCHPLSGDLVSEMQRKFGHPVEYLRLLTLYASIDGYDPALGRSKGFLPNRPAREQAERLVRFVTRAVPVQITETAGPSRPLWMNCQLVCAPLGALRGKGLRGQIAAFETLYTVWSPCKLLAPIPLHDRGHVMKPGGGAGSFRSCSVHL